MNVNAPVFSMSSVVNATPFVPGGSSNQNPKPSEPQATE